MNPNGISGNEHKNHRDRMRARFDASGFEGFHDHEVLEVLLYYVYPQGDTNPIAHRLLQQFGSLCRVMEASPEALAAVHGMGIQSARFLHLVFEVNRRYLRDGISFRAKDNQLNSTKKAAHFLAPYLVGLPYEAVAVACVDAQLRPLSAEVISKGTVNANEITVRKLTEVAMANHAYAIVIAHNHPHGTAAASGDDIKTTEELIEALHGVDVQLVDHIILADQEYTSLRDYGVFDRYR